MDARGVSLTWGMLLATVRLVMADQIAPVAPNAFRELVVDPEESIRSALVKVAVRLPVLLYRVMRWAFTATGSATPEFRLWVCEGCSAASEAAEQTMTAE